LKGLKGLSFLLLLPFIEVTSKAVIKDIWFC
jgi:hypothetical protein